MSKTLTDTDSESKVCAVCEIRKPLEEYYWYAKKTSRDRMCILCRKTRFLKDYAAKRDERLEKKSIWRHGSGKKIYSEWQKKNYLKQKAMGKTQARGRFGYNVKVGKILKQPCENCGIAKAEAHHYKGYDGDNWKEVRWLCMYHHKEAHGTLNKYVLESKKGAEK